MHNAILLGDTSRTVRVDEEVTRRLLRAILRSKDIGIGNKAMPGLTALFQITPLRSKIELDVRKMLAKLKYRATETNNTFNCNN